MTASRKKKPRELESTHRFRVPDLILSCFLRSESPATPALEKRDMGKRCQRVLHRFRGGVDGNSKNEKLLERESHLDAHAFC